MSGFEIELPSSPDPLGDESLVIPPASAAPPSTAKTRRISQSAVSSRFSALPGTSPRKRMFALDVGDEITHQTIYVTIEAGPDGNPITRGAAAGGSSVARRLFGSPTPQPTPHRGVRTTTTTIPLRGLTDDEAESIPRRRRRRSSGRPGTPTAAGPKRRKKGTPTPKATTTKPRATPVPSSDALQSETPAVLDQPTPKRRGRPPKRKAEVAPSEQDNPDVSQAVSRKRGRIRRQSLDPDDFQLLDTTSNDGAESQGNNEVPASKGSDVPHDPISDPAVRDGGGVDLAEDEEEDPFLAIPSDPPAGHERSLRRDQSMELSDPVTVKELRQDGQALGDHETSPPESDDYAPMMDYGDRSDVGSQRSEPVTSPAQSQQGHTELEDQGPLPDEPEDYAPMMDYNDRNDMGSYHSEATPRFSRQVKRQTSELEDQGTLPGESDDYAPMMEHDDTSDVESHHSEATPKPTRQIEDQTIELENQGPLPGESDDYAPMGHDGMVESHQSGATPIAEFQAERQTSELGDQGPLPGELDEYAPTRHHDDRSDAESHQSVYTYQDVGQSDNTVDPDTFTMIGIETMPSFRGNRDVPTSDLPEIGETTSLFINKTLDSLRQELVESEDDEGEVDLLGSREPTPAEAEVERSAVTSSFRRHQGLPSNPPENRSSRSISRSPRKLEPERLNAVTSSPWNRPQSSLSPLRQLGHSTLRSPRKSEPSLAHVASERSHRVGSSVKAVRYQEADDLRSSPDEQNDDEDSFSDIPDDVLAAAESPEESQPLKGPSEDELNWAASVVQNMAEENEYSHMLKSADSQNIDRLENTNSTLNRPNHHQTDEGVASRRSVSRSAQSRRRLSQSTQHSSPPHSIRSRSDSNRLLTPPDETTSSSDHGTPADGHAHNPEATSLTPDDIGSSPPEITAFDPVDERQMSSSRRDSDTPANPPPSIQLQPVQERITYASGFANQAFGPRPVLSPIVRAGSRLQNILSDPPSPSGRSSVLGSPFKGSARNSSPLDAPQGEDAAPDNVSPRPTSQNHLTQTAPRPAQPAAESPTKSWATSFGPLSRIKNMVSQFTSPSANVLQKPEDPFGSSSPVKERPGSAFMDRIRKASREESVYSSRASVARATVGDNDERGFAGNSASRASESSIYTGRTQNPGPFGSGIFQSRIQNDRPSTSCDGVMDGEPQAMSVDRRPEQPQTDGTGQHKAENQPQTDELSIEDAEQMAENVHSQHEEEQSDEDDMQVDDAPADDVQSEEEDIWAIEADRTASSPTAQRRANESITSFKKNELSIDWGTRSTMSSQPGRSPVFQRSVRNASQEESEDLDNYSLIGLNSGESNQPSSKKPTPEAQKQPKRADLSDFFSSSPNFIERERRVKEALLAESAAQSSAAHQLAHIASPQMTGEAQFTTSPSPKQLSSSSRASPELPLPIPAATNHTTTTTNPATTGRRTTQAATSRASSSLTPERPRRPQQRPPPAPQPQNDAALFETWSVVSSSRAASERPDPSLSSDARPSSPDAIERPSTPVDHRAAGPGAGALAGSRLLKPLPDRAASPSKSCLRSPLKPKTPGRVVEFTSSTMSTWAEAQAQAQLQAEAQAQAQAEVQARAGHQVRASILPAPAPLLENDQHPAGGGKKDESQSLDAYRTAPRHEEAKGYQHERAGQAEERDEEEPAEEEELVEEEEEEAVEPPLSRTRWSRRHWVFLDELLQAHRRSPDGFRSRYGSSSAASPGRPRRSRALLGKVVTSQGEEMVLGQWHLDVVDAFKGEVGGWPEDALAKRLFALIVGEERRRLGLVPKVR